MRLRTWIAVAVSVILLAAAGVVGVLVNRSALRAADTVHRADSTALGVNNGTLAGQLQVLSAQELTEFLAAHAFTLATGNGHDRALLQAYAAKSRTFSYGLMLVGLDGQVLTASRDAGIPDAADPGWTPMRTMLAAGQAGISSIMNIGTVHLEAIAVPISVGGSPAGVLIGLADVAEAQLQHYTRTLAAGDYRTAIVDSTGTVAAASDATLLGSRLDPAVRAAVGSTTAFVEYRSGGTPMIAIVAGGLPGGWAYVRWQTRTSFDGAVHSKSQTLNLTLLAMLLIGVAGIALLGYRSLVQRRRDDQRFQALFQHAPDLVSVLDAHGTIRYSSPSSGAILGFETGKMVGTSVFDLVHPADRDTMTTQFAALIANREGVVRLQCRVRPSDGRYRWFEFTASNQMQNPALHGVVINARDISETRAFQERLAHEALHDALTGLPNRRRMQDALGSSLRAGSVAVLFVDLDGFKPVNDAYGHEAGDELLRQVARRLSGCVREGDVLSRVGGDEFVVLMPGVLHPADAESMRDRIRTAIGSPFPIGGQDVRIGASVGLHLAPAATDPDEALREADHAMYAMKKAGEPTSGRHRAEP